MMNPDLPLITPSILLAMRITELTKPFTIISDMNRVDVFKFKEYRYMSLFARNFPVAAPFIEGFQTGVVAGRRVGDFIKMDMSYELKSHRYFAPTNTSIQGLPSEVRNFLLPDTAVEIDIIKSCLYILRGIYKKYQLPCPILVSVIQDYDSLQISSSMRDFKAHVMSAVFGDDIPHNTSYWVLDLNREVNWLSLDLKQRYPDVWEEAKNADDEKKTKKRKRGEPAYKENTRGLFLSLLVFKYENEILQAMDKAGRDAGYWDYEVSLRFDGLIIPVPLSPIDTSHLESAIKEQTGFDIFLAIKPKGSALDVNVNSIPESPIVTNHGQHQVGI